MSEEYPFCYTGNMLDFLTREQILWIHEHALLLAVLTVAVVGVGLCRLIIWLDGGIDDSMADFIPYVPSSDD